MVVLDALGLHGLDGLDFGPFDNLPPKNGTEPPSNMTPEEWNSVVGIITAIVGNVLISIALNTQRYAHLRLAKEAGDSTRRRQAARDHANNSSQQNPNRRPNGSTGGHEDANDEAHESDPLLPKSNDAASISSNSTAVPNDEKNDEPIAKKNYLRSPYWWTGIVLMVIGEAGNFIAYGFAPASIVSPLGVVALISNCLIAPFMLKEKFRMRDLLGVVISVAGAVTVVLSGDSTNPKLGQRQILNLIERWEFMTYLAITVTLIFVLMWASNKYGSKTIMIDIGLVGLFGGYTALATKGVASLFSAKLFNVFSYPITYVLILVLVVTAVMQIKYVNRALQRFNSTQVIPTQFVMFTIFVVVGSAILYREFEQASAGDVVTFLFGVALTFVGVWCITGDREAESTMDYQDEEQGYDLPSQNDSASSRLKPNPKNLRAKPSIDYGDPSSTFAATTSSHLTASFSAADSKHPLTSKSDTDLSRESSHVEQALPRPTTPATRFLPPIHTDTGSTLTPVPTIDQQQPGATTPSSSFRRVFNRQSIASGMTPGPYLPPLSSGLSVVVADNARRRDSASSPRPQVRRRSLRQQQQDHMSRTVSMGDAEMSASSAGSGSPTRGMASADTAAESADEGVEAVRGVRGMGERSISVEVASGSAEQRAGTQS